MISGPDTTFRLRGWHPLWLAFQNHSSISRCKPRFSAEKLEVPQPRTCNSCRISHMFGLASSAFARHYLRNHGCFLFLWVLRCFTSPRSLYPPYIFRRESLGHKSAQRGFPIRKSSDQGLLISSPRLIADCYVLLRLQMPRHPPSALRNLTT
jgi:hypothetical protein